MNSTYKPIVLVTGGTGFLGSYIVDLLLGSGYTVRASARPAKVASFKATYPDAGDRLQIVQVSDIATDDLTDAFKGVGALIHTASPLYTRNISANEIIEGAINGTANVLTSAIKGGVRKIIYTGTVGALYDLNLTVPFGTQPMNETFWTDVSFDDIDSVMEKEPPLVYIASKALAEKKFWEVARQNPDIDFTSILPPAIYGDWLRHYPPPGNRTDMGANGWIYGLIAGGPDGPNTYPDASITHWSHVNNVARAHVVALTSPPHKSGKEKRLILLEGQFTWSQAIELLKKARPELSSRLPDPKLTPPPSMSAPLDPSLTNEVLGKDAFTGSTWRETVLETIDALVGWEQRCANH